MVEWALVQIQYTKKSKVHIWIYFRPVNDVEIMLKCFVNMEGFKNLLACTIYLHVLFHVYCFK